MGDTRNEDLNRDEPQAEGASASGRPLLRLAVLGLISALAGYGAVYVSFNSADNRSGVPSSSEPVQGEQQAGAPAAAAGAAGERSASVPAGSSAKALRPLARGKMVTFAFAEGRTETPELAFKDGDGKAVSLKDWRGRYVLLNLWATWCAPCREEMPALSRLKSDLAGPDFDVVTLSVDQGGLAKPRAFLEKEGLTNLPLYNLPGLAAARALKAIGMPTTVLIDPQGRVVGRLAGPAEWDSADAKALIRGVIAADKAGT